MGGTVPVSQSREIACDLNVYNAGKGRRSTCKSTCSPVVGGFTNAVQRKCLHWCSKVSTAVCEAKTEREAATKRRKAEDKEGKGERRKTAANVSVSLVPQHGMPIRSLWTWPKMSPWRLSRGLGSKLGSLGGTLTIGDMANHTQTSTF